MTINEAYQHLKSELKNIYDEKEAANISELVIERICGLKKTDRILHKQQVLNSEQENLLHSYLQQLIKYKPVQYVLNEAWFAGMKFFVDEHVLIPRPETEELVNWIVEERWKFQDTSLKMQDTSLENSPFTILDVGTGSGCIAIALKKKITDAEVFALDVSNEALKIASLNAQQNNTDINFLKADILHKQLHINIPLFDIIVSNPPYITQNESAEMNLNVINYEPHVALFVPDENPLLFYDAISNFALSHLKQNGKLFFEVHENFANDVVNLLQQKNFQSIEIKKDLQQKNRMVKAVFYK